MEEDSPPRQRSRIWGRRPRCRNLVISILLIVTAVIIGSVLLLDDKLVKAGVGAQSQDTHSWTDSKKANTESTEEPSSPLYSTIPPPSSSSEPSTKPTPSNTNPPTRMPSLKPSTSSFDTNLPSSYPSVISSYPSISSTLSSYAPSNQNEVQDKFDDIHFYVLGDIPYNRAEQLLLESQLQTIEESIAMKNDTSAFIVHVGDLMSAYFSKCPEERYSTIATIFKESVSIPVLTTPGDNEWNKCPDVSAAKSNYTKYFVGIEEHWNDNVLNPIANSVERSGVNWAFAHSNIVFISINMIEEVASDEVDPLVRINDNIAWFQEACNQHNCESSRAVVIFGHSISNAHIVFDRVDARLRSLQIPVVYFTGNGHEFMVKRGVGMGVLPGDYFWRVQVDSGKAGPPLSVTFRGNANMASSADLTADGEGEFVFGGAFKIDRRVWANTTSL